MGESGVVVGPSSSRVEERLLGEVVGDPSGPTLLCVAGIHGNEPAGVHAVRRVLEALDAKGTTLTGRFVALAGNVTALNHGRRFVDRDLNRAWTPARLAQLRSEPTNGGSVEDREQVELLSEIERVIASARGAMFALDLHTTSGPGGIFSAFTDALPHRTFASGFPIPMIFGLEELVDGTLLNLLSEHGVVALTVETGQHEEPASVDRAEAAVWLALVSSGVVAREDAPDLEALHRRLGNASRDVPRALEMRYKRDVEDGDGFRMRPGYRNFQSVAEGEVVAVDHDGDVALSEPGRLLMPLYQEQGEDGFFLVREFSPFWMGVSSAMRRLGLARAAVWLPGVSRVPGTVDEVEVDRRVARFFARQLFHLLGFRQLEQRGRTLVMRRRPFDGGRYLRRPPEPRTP